MFFDTLFLHNGDRVRVTCDSENDSVGIVGIANKEGMIVGFGERAFGRVKCFGIKPGVYRDLASPFVVFDGDRAQRRFAVPACHVRHLDPVLDERRGRAVGLVPDAKWREAIERNYLRKLEDTTFWEGDTVFLTLGLGRVVPRTVVAIDHDALMSSEDPEKVPVYGLAEHIDDGPERWCTAAEIALMQRGNLYRLRHGHLLVYPSKDELQEELSLAVMLGEYDFILPPEGYRTRRTWWAKPAATAALREGRIDWVLVERAGEGMWSCGPESAPRRFGVKFHDLELGARLAMRALRALSR